MATKENFNKAVFDMFGVGSDPSSANPKTAPAQEPATAAAPTDSAAPAVEAPAPTAAEIVRPAPYVPASRPAITYLAPGTSMEGKLKAQGDVEVAGDFKGDLSASGNVVIHASINSNITAARLELVACCLTGDAHVSGPVLIDAESTIEGNLFAEDLICAGKVKGDLQITGNTTFRQSAHAEGNITTGTMSMDCGAVISGSLCMTGSSKAAKPAPAKKSASDTEVFHSVH